MRSTQTKWVFLNDGFVKEANAKLHFRDLSFQRGYGIFDFFRLRGNEPLFLADHLERFYRSAAGAHLPVKLTENELTAVIHQLIEKTNRPGTGIRISLTGGYSDDGFSIGKPALLLSQHSIAPLAPQQLTNGIRLLTHPYQRQLPHIKTIDYFTAIWLQPWLKSKAGDDVLYHNNGFVTECPRSNFFLVTKDNRIVTPLEGVLKGITRQKAIQLASQKFSVEERPIRLEEIALAQEAFVTSTTKRLLPVASIDETAFHQRKVSVELRQLFINAFGD